MRKAAVLAMAALFGACAPRAQPAPTAVAPQHDVAADDESFVYHGLVSADFPDIPDRRGYLFRIELKAGRVSRRHWHPGDEIVYVVAGHGSIDYADGTRAMLVPGASVFVPARKPHVDRNDSATESLEVLVFLITPKLVPITVEGNGD